MRPFFKLLVAELKEFVRERPALFWTFAFPILFILLFGAAFGEQESARFEVGLVAEDTSALAQGFAQNLEQVPAFQLHRGSRQAELQALKEGDRQAVLVVAQGFGEAVAQGRAGEIEVLYDPSQTTVVQVVLPIVRKVVSEFERAVARTPTVVNLVETSIQAHRLRFIDFFVPGIVAMALMQLGIFAAVPLVVQRENRILKRLGATPLPRSTFVASMVSFRLLLSVVQTLLIIFVGRLVFHVQMQGNWFYLMGMVLLGASTFVSMGYVVAALVRTQETAMPLLMAIQFPMMFLGGVFWPLEFMPDFLVPVVKAIPLTYLGDSLRQIVVSASALHSQLVNILVLAGWLIGCLALAIRFFRWE